ncbi:hypothetical protein DFP72DRAFT_798059 [Ephemerocybe angulata]|uniref:Protein SQS1 n=1 Tax=Ephemerocybe angulata TaxID=980116 RepID=A0A8H6MGX1_9AGAR|nr:hypothetical protein DFP72DRAFT_798059 [Tulosesus angulatus]
MGRGWRGSGEDSDDDSDSDSESEEEEEEESKVVDMEEELMMAEDLMAAMSVESDNDDDDDDDDEEYEEEKTPRSNFTARLERLRQQSLKSAQKGKGKGKAKMEEDDDDDEFDDDMDFDDDDDDDPYFKKNMKWVEEKDEDELIELVQGLLDENQDILSSHGDRKKRNKLFKAISNGEFDYMDEDFSFSPAKRGKKAKRDSIPRELQAQWDKDREAKAVRKQQRELEKLLRAGDPFASKKGGKKGRKAMLAAARLDPTITVLSNRIMDLSTLVQMLHKFVNDLGGKSSLSLPPTDKETRKNVHELAIAFNLKSVSKGKGDSRYVTVVKTTRTAPGRVDERKVARIVRRSGGPGARGNDFTSGSAGGRGGGGGKGVFPPKHKEGEVVGKAAPKIAASNIGFKMLAMMGWSEGQRIGDDGLDAPIEAVIKHSKLGLGAMK